MFMTRTGFKLGFGVSGRLLVSATLICAAPLGCGSQNNAGPGDSVAGGSPGSATGGRGAGGSTAKGGSGGGPSGSGGSVGGDGGSAGGGSPTGSGGSAGTSGSDAAAGGTGGSSAGGSSGGGGSAPEAGAPEAGPSNPMRLTGNGCIAGACKNPTCDPMGTAAPIGSFAEIAPEDDKYIPAKYVIPTFDDVTDRVWTTADTKQRANFGEGDWTRKTLEWLNANDLHVDFFINANNFCDATKDPNCQAVVTGLLKTQNAANHTIHHIHMGGSSADKPVVDADSSCGPGKKTSCESELMGVETLIDTLSMGGIPHLTRFRAPYGEPFVGGGGPGLDSVKKTVAKFAVHVGWQMDSTDSLCDECKYTGQKIAGIVEKALGAGPGKGQHGIVLMHATYPWSYDAAKILFDPKTGYAQTHGFELATVEDVICWKYGMHSWKIVEKLNPGQTRTDN